MDAQETHAPSFSKKFIGSVSNICSNVANFPAKKLWKNGAQNTHAPFFFFFKFSMLLFE